MKRTIGTLVPDRNLVVPVVFPHYRVGYYIGGMPVPITRLHLPRIKIRIPFLGHAGILFIRESGHVHYFEYGFYDDDPYGVVKERNLFPDCIKKEKDFKALLHFISKKYGKKTLMEGVFCEVQDIDSVLDFARRYNSPYQGARLFYSEWKNNCMTYVVRILRHSGIVSLKTCDPRPRSYVKMLQRFYPGFSYDPERRHYLACKGQDSG